MRYLVWGVNLCGVCKMEKHVSFKLERQRKWSPSLILSLREIGGVEITTLWGRHESKRRKQGWVGGERKCLPYVIVHLGKSLRGCKVSQGIRLM